tara:strand:- start:2824 stop:3738 length:915 start_codon:yes stop_codon:yes gene_type:complete
MSDKDSVVTLDLGKIPNLIISFRYFILSILIIFSSAGVIFALSLPNNYKSEVLLSAVSQKSQAAIGLGGISGLPGVSSLLGGNSANANIEEAVEILNSQLFLSNFIEKYGLDKYIIAGEDYKNNSIIFDKKFIDQDGEWVKKNKPSTETVLREFKTYHLEIKDDIDKGFVILSIEYLSPVLAYEWVNRMVSDINNTLRERDVTKAEASINYLETKLSETKITGLTEVFSSLLEEQYKTVMLANSTENYFFDVIDPAFISEYKSSPSRSIICVFFFITGFLFALIILFLKEPLNLKIKNSLLIFR